MSDKKEKFFKKIEIEIDGSDKEGKKEPKNEKKDKGFFKKKDFRSKDEDDNKEHLDEGKKNRCWKGYKPTPGKKPYSSDSCIKEGSSYWSNWKMLRESTEGCSCQCNSCKTGNCEGCSCKNCNCEGCSC